MGYQVTKKWSHQVTPEEFDRPEQMDARLVNALVKLRQWLDKPMHFTFSGGQLRHPYGDAVPPHSPHHAPYSLHKWGILHARSEAEDRIVKRGDYQGLACDFDTGATTLTDLFNTYWAIERLSLFGGIGVYPHWRHPGFHVDLRPRTHRAYGARWIRKASGQYYPLTPATFKEYLP